MAHSNHSKDRFRRAFIGHYVGESTSRIGKHYQLYDAEGNEVDCELNMDFGPCGIEALSVTEAH